MHIGGFSPLSRWEFVICVCDLYGVQTTRQSRLLNTFRMISAEPISVKKTEKSINWYWCLPIQTIIFPTPSIQNSAHLSSKKQKKKQKNPCFHYWKINSPLFKLIDIFLITGQLPAVVSKPSNKNVEKYIATTTCYWSFFTHQPFICSLKHEDG